MAELLDQQEIDDALESLPGWAYDENKLVRTVPVEPDSVDNLERAVQTVSDQLNHHPKVEHRDGELQFQLWTHTAGGVTAKDVELAARIDQTLTGPVQD
jgi:4a-hydroxytetrahydrobiopterin dehydratase